MATTITPRAARNVLIVSLGVSAVAVTIASIRKGEAPKPRAFVGIGGVYIFTAVMVELVPPIGAGFALLAATAIVLQRGGAATEGILRAATRDPGPVTPGASDVFSGGDLYAVDLPAAPPAGGPAVPGLPVPPPIGVKPPAAGKGSIIGRPYQGTHSRGNWQSDNAIDISLPVGTTIIAPFDGVISPSAGYGPSILDGKFDGLKFTLDGGGGRSSYFTHLSRLDVRQGVRVRKGQQLGLSGVSSNGVPHLHYAIAPPFSPWSFYHSTYR